MIKFRYHSSRLFNVLTVILLAGLCLLLNELTRIDFQRIELPKNKPEFSATDFQANLFSPQGDLLYRVNAATGKQFPDSTKIAMQQVDVQAFGESNSQMHEQITSSDGWLDTKSTLGFLGENVIMTLNESDPKT